VSKLLSALFLVASGLCAQPWAGIIASNRAVDWSHAGISGGIPSASWTQCGATISAYSGSGSTIVNALNHTGTGYTGCSPSTYIQLGAGTFTLSSGIRNIGASNTELRGMGANQTLLVYTGTSTCQGGNGTCLLGFESSDGTYPAQPPASVYNWTGGYAQGATSITVSSGVNITANSTMVMLDQCETGYSGSTCTGTATDNGALYVCGDAYATSGPTGCSVNGPDTGLARPHRFQTEAVLVTACSPSCGSSGSTVLTIDTPLRHPNWASGQTPQVWLIQPAMNVGVQNLSINGAATTDTGGVSFYNVANFWSQGVAVLHSYNIGIWIEQSIHGIVQSNYVFDSGQNLTYNDPTGIKYNWASNLIANNIVQAVRPTYMCEGPCVGNVIVGNFGINSYTGDDYMFGSEWDGHSDGADYDLIESNVVNQITEDLIHGGHLMQTIFRNLATGWESCANGTCGAFTSKSSDQSAVSSQSFNRYENFIANVLGTPGYNTTYQASSGNCATDYEENATVWVLGCGNSGGATAIPSDLTGLATIMRWGNYDTANASVQWNSGEVPSGISVYPNSVPSGSCTSGSPTCPSSFYYSSRPSWWSASIPFPAIGPDVSSGNLGICSGTRNTSGHFSGVPATASGQCTGTTLTASQWGGHANAIPAMSCYLSVMGGPPDGSGSALTFNPTSCYASTPASGTYMFIGETRPKRPASSQRADY
jgi:hypothetical protein